jgi:DNA-binding CsgD family transcriptional regulator
MMTVHVSTVMASDYVPSRVDASAMISAIGTSEFEGEFLNLANEICGAEHLSVMHLHDHGVAGRGSASLDHSAASSTQLKLYIDGDYWRRDPGLMESQRQITQATLSMVKVEISTIEDANLRNTIWSVHNIAQRLLLCVGRPGNALAVSMCRSEHSGAFGKQDILNLQRWAQPLVSILKKHAAISWAMPPLPSAITSLANVEECIRNSGVRLPRRESEVCARLIYGMTTTGVALELEIGEGSVMTYRKRIYERLGIGSQRELLIWYLALWDQKFARCLRAV